MTEGTSMQDHLNEFSRLLSELLNMEVTLEEEDKVAVLVASLPKKYDHLVTTMLYGKKTIVLDEVKSTLLSEEKRKSTFEVDEKNVALFVRRGTENRGPQSSRYKPKNYKIKTCYYCHEEGHIIMNCPKLKEKKAKGKDKVQNEGSIAAMANDSEDEDCALMATAYSNKSFNDVWVLDSGCSFHMCPNRDSFSSYKEVESGSVWLANGKAFKISGIGTIKIKTCDGLVKTLRDVRHVPNLRRNLISVGVLDSKGYKIVTAGGVMEVVMGSLVIMKGKKVGNLYFLQGSTVGGGATMRSSTVNNNSPFVTYKEVKKSPYVKISNLNSRSGCGGAKQHYGGMKLAFRWQPKLQQSL